MRVKARIIRCLRHSSLADDPAGAALAGLPGAIDRGLFPKHMVPAAVLMPLILHERGMTLLLTRRAGHLRDHPGQVCFPGGRVEAGDASALHTALREVEEEIGLRPAQIEVAGYLAPQAVITGFAVTPVVGFVRPGLELILDRSEVTEAFEIPLAFFLDPAHLLPDRRLVEGGELTTCQYRYQGHRIWGVTAFMIRQLCEEIDKTID